MDSYLAKMIPFASPLELAEWHNSPENSRKITCKYAKIMRELFAT